MSELSRATRALLEKGREGEPLPAKRRSGMKRAVFAHLAASSIVGTTSTASAWTVWGTFAAKSIAVVALTGAVTGGVVHAVRSQPLSPAVAVLASARPAVPQRVAPRVAVPIETPRANASSTPPEPAVAVLGPEEGSRLPAAETAWVITPAARPEPSRTAVAPVAPPPSTVASSPRPSPLAQEVELLRGADAALKTGDGARTLALLDELDKAVPGGNLRPERAAERVFALCMAGKIEQAQRQARAFLAIDPSGPLAARVRASCGKP
jgi:Protein of unknown function (DUF2379)